MKNIIILCVTVFAVILTASCSKSSERKTSDYMEQGSFTGDPTTTIKTDGKFLFDLQWTEGPAFYDYKSAAGDTPLADDEKAYEPWFLIPYGETTEFFITAESEENAEDYVCRDLNAQYSLENELEIAISEKIKTHQQMMCVPVNNVVATANNSELEYKDEKLYHIRNIEGLYSIEGHVNLRLVKPINLRVFWEVILDETMAKELKSYKKEDIDKIKDDWKMYMKKIGYNIEIITIPLVFKEDFILPKEKGILELNSSVINKFNSTMTDFGFLRELFGANPNSSNIQQTGYVIATTPGYKLKYNLKKRSYTQTGLTETIYLTEEPVEIKLGWCYIEELISSEDRAFLYYDYSSIEYYAVSNDWDDWYYGYDYYGDGFIKNLGFGNSPITTSEKDCNNISYAEGNYYSLNTFSFLRGYALSDYNLFKRKNTGRLLASLFYSRLLGIIDPVDNNNNGRWLSSYIDEAEVEQPKKDWRREIEPKRQKMLPQQDIQQEQDTLKTLDKLPEFAYIFKNP